MTDPRRILIYGDSNSFGCLPMETLASDSILPRGARWGDQLANGLGEDWEVVIEGLPGRTAVLDDPVEGAHKNGLTVLPAILQSHRPIDLFILCLGTNDRKARFGLTGQDVALGVARVAREALASGLVAKALIVAPPPVRESGCLAEMFGGAETRTASMTAHLEDRARIEGAAFFDAGAVIDVDPLDGVHWSAEAHQALADALVPVVKDLF